MRARPARATPSDLYGAEPALEHGWAPTTPTTDTVARQLLLAVTASTVVPSLAMGARDLVTTDVVATTLGRPAGYWNAAYVQRPLPLEGWEQLVDDLDEFAGTGTGSDLWSPFPTPDLSHRGWTLAGHPVVMWRPPAHRTRSSPAGLTVRRIEDAAGLATWARHAVAWYPVPVAPGDFVSAELLDDPDVHVFLASVDAEPVAVGLTVVAHGVNAVTFIAADPARRRKGYGEAVSWAATQADPELPAALVASEEGRPTYERVGYLPLARWTMWLPANHGHGV